MATQDETLKKDMAELRAALDQLTKDVSTLSKNFASSINSEVRENMKKAADQAREKGKQSAEAVGVAVGEHPFRSLLIAFGAGVLMSLLVSRRGADER
ncbi:MAG: hypothetical protein RLO05_05660 [Rhodospirillales bacterium]